MSRQVYLSINLEMNSGVMENKMQPVNESVRDTSKNEMYIVTKTLKYIGLGWIIVFEWNVMFKSPCFCFEADQKSFS